MELARAKGMEPVIPSKRNRKEQREHDWERYKASGGKHLTLFEAMARNCDKIRQKNWLVCGCGANVLHILVGLDIMTTAPKQITLTERLGAKKFCNDSLLS